MPGAPIRLNEWPRTMRMGVLSASAKSQYSSSSLAPSSGPSLPAQTCRVLGSRDSLPAYKKVLVED